MKGDFTIKGSGTNEVLWLSDNLGFLRELTLCLPQFEALFGQLPQIRVVLDANVVLAELIYRLKRKRKAHARTSLHEVISAQTVIAYAPVTLSKEVEANIPLIAIRRGLSQDRLQEEWEEFKALLNFYEPPARDDRLHTEVADPKDLPYCDLSAEVGARGVYSKDRHISRMGVPIITIDVFLALRDYSRAASIEVGIKVGEIAVAAAGIELLRGMLILLSAAARGLSRLPTAAKLAIGAIGVIAVAHPKSRKFMETVLQSAVKQLSEIALPVFAEVSRSLSDAERDRIFGWERASKMLPAGKRYPAKTHLRAVCIATKGPLSLLELERQVLSAGYVTRAKNLRPYLKRILQNDPCFVRVRSQEWAISRP